MIRYRTTLVMRLRRRRLTVVHDVTFRRIRKSGGVGRVRWSVVVGMVVLLR